MLTYIENSTPETCTDMTSGWCCSRFRTFWRARATCDCDRQEKAPKDPFEKVGEPLPGVCFNFCVELQPLHLSCLELGKKQ